MSKGLLIILSGPSGVGKGTVREYIVKTGKVDLAYSVSMTTREPRKGERNGVDYYFVSEEEFERNIEENNFLEWNCFVKNKYGTPKDKVLSLLDQGKNVFLEIDINGASQVLNNYKGDNLITFYLMPPSMKTLENRIRNRHTEDENTIKLRLDKASTEMKQAKMYDYVIINDRITRAGDEIIEHLLEKTQR